MLQPSQIAPLPRALLGGVAMLVMVSAGCGGARSQQAAKRRAKSHVERGDQCFARGDYACALAELKQAARARARDPQLLNRIAIVARLRYYQTGDEEYRDQELEAIKKAARLSPNAVQIQVNYATTCWQIGRRREAARAYRRAVLLDPRHPDLAEMRRRIASAKKGDDEQ